MKTNQIHDVLVIGAGVKGLNSAYKILDAGEKLGVDVSVVVAESRSEIGQEMSRTDHNSAMGHSGQYYDLGNHGKRTAKSIYNERGFNATLSFCKERGIHIKNTGKLTVGYSDGSRSRLESYANNAIRNGRNPQKVRLISGDEARVREPLLGRSVRHALFLEEPYMFDANAINNALKNEVKTQGGMIMTGCRVTNIETDHSEDVFVVHTTGGEIKTRFIVNQAGARVHQVARMLGGGDGWGIVPIEGRYMHFKSPTGKSVKAPIYQVPEDEKFPFLDPHAIPTADGYVALGPTAMPTFGKLDTASSNTLDRVREHMQPETWKFYVHMFLRHREFIVRETLSSLSREYYARRCRRLFDADQVNLRGSDLAWFKAGIRGQLVQGGRISRDFPVEAHHSANSSRLGAITFMNPGSPGYTAAPAIGESTATYVMDSLGIATREKMADLWGINYVALHSPLLKR